MGRLRITRAAMALAWFSLLTTCARKNVRFPPSGQEATVEPAAGVPLIPTEVTAVEGNRSVTVTWNPVAGAASYNVYYTTSPAVSKTNGTKLAGLGKTSHRVRGLANKTPYFFAVTAVNAAGESPESAAVLAAPPAKAPRPELVRVPGGAFEMGDNLDRTSYALPVHEVYTDEFYIDRYETMYSLWKEVYDWAVAHGYQFDNPGLNGSSGRGNNLPVTMISWYDALKWLNARSEKEGRAPVVYTDDAHKTIYREGRIDLMNSQVKWDADGYRLPTEAEWEKAARGGLKGKRYPWGDEPEAGKANDNLGAALPVGLYPPNGYGLHDMAGNVFEWVWDWGSESQAYDWAGAVVKNPPGPDSSPKGTRIRRGGGFKYGSRYLKCYERMFRAPTYTAPYFGFRTVTNRLK